MEWIYRRLKLIALRYLTWNYERRYPGLTVGIGFNVRQNGLSFRSNAECTKRLED